MGVNGDGGGGGEEGAAASDDGAHGRRTTTTAADAGASVEGAEMAINSDFDLHDELASRGWRVSAEERIDLMMEKYRTRPIFGVIENKLLAHSLLHSLGVPLGTIEYGAFARHQLGEWHRHDPKALRSALERVHADPHGAVLKPATDGGSVGLLLLSGAGSFPNGSLLFRTDRHNGTVWRRHRWSAEAIEAHVTGLLQPGAQAPSARWQQRYEHRGLLLQRRYLCAGNECRGAQHCAARGEGAARSLACLAEVKVHVVFGRLSCMVVERVPVRFDDSLYVTVDANAIVDCTASQARRRPPATITAAASRARRRRPHLITARALHTRSRLTPTAARRRLGRRVTARHLWVAINSCDWCSLCSPSYPTSRRRCRRRSLPIGSDSTFSSAIPPSASSSMR